MSTNYFCSPFSERVRRLSKSLLIILKRYSIQGTKCWLPIPWQVLEWSISYPSSYKKLFKSGQHPGCEKSGRMVTFQFFIEECCITCVPILLLRNIPGSVSLFQTMVLCISFIIIWLTFLIKLNQTKDWL